MNTRIRYEKTETPNKLVSVRTYSVNNKDCRVYLYVDTMKYEIFDTIAADLIYSSGEGVSLSNLKIKAKKALEALGIAFEEENRPPRRAVPSL